MTRHTIFQKAICNLAVITFVCSLLVFCPVHASAEALPAEAEPVDLALERLNKYAETVMEQKEHSFGYPGNLDIHLTGFYEWLLESGVYSVIANNAGDPFDNNDPYMNTLDFEREVIEYFAPLYGFDPDDLWGIVTFSGTDGNNHGIYFGSKYLERKTGEKPVVYVSDAAHYSNMRLVDLQNLDLVLVPSDVHGCMIPEEFEKALITDRPALVVYAMGTTFKGGIDDQEALNAILAKYPDMAVYRHVDAALFGGFLPFSEYADAVNRKVQPFDSIAISGHKFFGMDEPAGLFFTTMEVKENQNPYEVAYLNGSMPMINCSRSAIAPLKFWWIIRHTSLEDFARQASGMLERAAWLKSELDRMGWPAWLEPMSNTVYFKRPSTEITEKYALAPDSDERLGGDLSHIVVMQHVTEDRLQLFLDDLASQRTEVGDTPAQPEGDQTYTVVFVDEEGNPVPEVMAAFCTADKCHQTESDEEGKCTYTGPADSYHVTIVEVPDGFIDDFNDDVYTEKYSSGSITIVLRKE